jgi:hypothetical protein
LDCAAEIYLNKLQKFQNKTLGVITNLRRVTPAANGNQSAKEHSLSYRNVHSRAVALAY